MNRTKFLSSLLVGALFLASTSVFVSCKDYDDDIKNLQAQIDSNKKTLDQINTLVTSGSVITNVEKTTTGDGGIIITLSNGQSYTVSNGAKGANGKDAVIWTIGNDGYWYKDGVKTDYKAVGEKGEAGAAGAAGSAGAQGPAGKDGKYYVPNADGYWYVVEDGVSTKTDVKWATGASGSLSVTVDEEGNVQINGLEGEETVTLWSSNAVRSIVFEKDNLGRVYVDGVPGIRVASFRYKALTSAQKEYRGENWYENGSQKVINPTTYASYHINPANANEKDLKDLMFVIKKNAEYYNTRATASNDFNVTPEFESFVDGILTVKVNVTGTAATGSYISVAALQAKKANDEVVTSDYAAIYNYDMDSLRFVNKKIADLTSGNWPGTTIPYDTAHYRRMVINNDVKYDKYHNDYIATNGPVRYMPLRTIDAKVWDTQDGSDWDIELAYNDETGKDLNDYVIVHNFGNDRICKNEVADLEALGMTVKYEVVANYILGNNNTNQKDFIDLNGSVIKAKVFGTTGTAAIGRTPIIRASLMKGNDVVEVAYIKVKIVGEEVEPTPDYITIDFGNIDFRCGGYVVDPDLGGTALKTTVEQINVDLYNVLREYGISREIFYRDYTADASTFARSTSNIGLVTDIDDTHQTETTHLLMWEINENELWNNSNTDGGKEITHVIKYNNANGGSVSIKLVAKVNKYEKTRRPVSYINEYWNNAQTLTYFNVNVPTTPTDTNPFNCLFENDLNSPFKTYPLGAINSAGNAIDGIVEIDNTVDVVEYAFHSSMTSGVKTFGGKQYSFTIDNIGTKPNRTYRLWSGGEVIATIENATWINTHGNTIKNVLKLNKYSDIAKELLNTNEFKVNIMATGYVCNSPNRDVKVVFKGETGEWNQDYYVAQFRRPIMIDSNPTKHFIDGVDFGQPGSYINIKDLINPYDWRGKPAYSFSAHPTYWKYYGIEDTYPNAANPEFVVTFDENDPTMSEIQLNGTFQEIPATIALKYVSSLAGVSEAAPYGFITYVNNGTSLLVDTQVRLRVVVRYGWGEFLTQWITVPVEHTVSLPE